MSVYRESYGGARTRSIPGQHLSDGTPAYLHVTGPDDLSCAQYAYDPACSLCWLGAPHSTNRHNEVIKKK